MPVYEYECGSCGARFEVMQKFSDPAVTMCKFCKAETVRKVLSPTAFVLKGSGWYATDYASNERKRGEQGDKSEKSCGKSKKDPDCSRDACASGDCSSKGPT